MGKTGPSTDLIQQKQPKAKIVKAYKNNNIVRHYHKGRQLKISAKIMVPGYKKGLSMNPGFIGARRFLFTGIGSFVSEMYKRFSPRRVRILGITYQIHSGVFNPKFLGISEFMAENVKIEPEQMVIDMCTGSGILAITASDKAHLVIAVDSNPAAVRCAKENAYINNLDNIQTITGDLFSPLKPNPVYDVILIHPPFFVNKPKRKETDSGSETKESFAKRFFKDAASYIKTGGYIQMVYPSFASPQIILQIAHEEGWDSEVVSQRKILPGTIFVYKFIRRANDG